jgi:hypothetical protein
VTGNSALLADWPPEKQKEARRSGSLLEPSELADVVMFMLTRSRGMTIRDVVMLPTNFDLSGGIPSTPICDGEQIALPTSRYRGVICPRRANHRQLRNSCPI